MGIKKISENEYEISSFFRVAMALAFAFVLIMLPIFAYLGGKPENSPLDIFIILFAVIGSLPFPAIAYLFGKPVRVKIDGDQLVVKRFKTHTYNLQDIKSVSGIRYVFHAPAFHCIGLEFKNNDKILLGVPIYHYATQKEIEEFAEKLGQHAEKKIGITYGILINIPGYKPLWF